MREIVTCEFNWLSISLLLADFIAPWGMSETVQGSLQGIHK